MAESIDFLGVASAQPGTELLTDRLGSWGAVPLIGWGIQRDGSIVPISLKGPQLDLRDYAVLLPDGTVAYGDYRYDDVSEFQKMNHPRSI